MIILNTILTRTAQTDSLPKPDNFKMDSRTTTSITVSWGALDGAVKYNVYKDGTLVNSVVNTSFVFQDLTHNTEYGLSVAGVTINSNEGFKATIAAKTLEEVIVEDQTLITGIVTPPANFWGFFTNDQLGEVKQRYNSAEYSSERGVINGHSWPSMQGFECLMTNNGGLGVGNGHAKGAYDEAMRLMGGITSYTAYMHFMEEAHQAALAFMWCKDYWNTTQKTNVEAEMWRIFHLPSAAENFALHTLTEHHVTGPLTARLMAGIACYGFNNRLWDEVATHWFTKVMPDNRQWMKSGFHYFGNYVDGRGPHLLGVELMMRAMTGKRGYFPVENMLDHYIHMIRPDGIMTSGGDTTDKSGKGILNASTVQMLACLTRSPIAKSLYETGPYTNVDVNTGKREPVDGAARLFGQVLRIVYDWNNIGQTDYQTSKKAHYYPEPAGNLIAARETWAGNVKNPADNKSPLIPYVHWKLGRMKTMSHQHADFGDYLVYYGGPILQEETFYDGSNYGGDDHQCYIQQTVSHNSILIYHSGEGQVWRGQRDGPLYNSGGQPWVVNTTWNEVETSGLLGFNIGHYISGDEKVIYLSGDITESYNSVAVKAAKVTRSFFGYFTGRQDYPFVQIIFDRVWPTSTGYIVVNLMHTGKPITANATSGMYQMAAGASGRKTNVTGKLVGYNLLGGKQRLINGHYASWDGQTGERTLADKHPYWENMFYRLQYEKSGELKYTFMQAQSCVNPSASTNIPVPKTNITGNARVGEIMGELAAVASEDGSLFSSSFTFTLTQSARRLVIADLAPGSWKFNNNTLPVGTNAKSIEAQVVPAGTYTVTKV